MGIHVQNKSNFSSFAENQQYVIRRKEDTYFEIFVEDKY